tara:strand:- start:1023 stop:1346 length:324 start_codon:yes stop_codon:yes gene_type:complete
VSKTSDRCGLPCDNPKECPEILPYNGKGNCEGYLEEEWANACPECVRDFGTPYSANCDCGTLCGDHCYKCHPPRDTKGRFVSRGAWERWSSGNYSGYGPRRPMPAPK